MGKFKKSQLVLLNDQEVQSKIRQLIDHKANLLIDIDDQVTICDPPIEYREKLLLFKEMVNLQADKTYPFCFELGKVQFLGSLKISKLEAGLIAYSIADNALFKLEKRSQDRLLTYPHDKYFIFVKLTQIAEGGHVVPFRKDDRKAIELIKKYEEETKQEKVGEGGYLEHGFRVLDFSANGVSFLVNRQERDLLEEQDFLSDIILKGPQCEFKVEGGKIESTIDFINPKAPGVPMFKVGIKFKKRCIEIDEFLHSDDRFESLNRVVADETFMHLLNYVKGDRG